MWGMWLHARFRAVGAGNAKMWAGREVWRGRRGRTRSSVGCGVKVWGYQAKSIVCKLFVYVFCYYG